MVDLAYSGSQVTSILRHRKRDISGFQRISAGSSFCKKPHQNYKTKAPWGSKRRPGEIPWTLQIFLDAFKWVLDVLEGSSLLGVWSKAKTTKIIFIHIRVFVSFLPIHIETLENGLNYLNLGMRMCESWGPVINVLSHIVLWMHVST